VVAGRDGQMQAVAVKERTAATARQRLIVIFCLASAAGLVIAGMALREVGGTSRRVDEVLSQHTENLLQVERLSTLSERLGRVARSFLLTGEEDFVEELGRTRQQFAAIAARLSSEVDTDEARQVLEVGRQAEQEYQRAVGRAIALRDRRTPSLESMARLDREVQGTRERLDLALAALAAGERHDFDHARAEATSRARSGVRVLGVAIVAALLLAIGLAWALGRTLAGLSRSRAELDASLARLEGANRDLDAFAGRIAHDLRNILAPLPLTAARLRQQAHDRAFVETSADRIERVGRRAEGLIEALLAFARAGQPTDAAAAAPAKASAHEALDDLAQLRSLVDAEVTVEGDDLEVRCAPSLLYTVMANLLSNALKCVEGRPRRQVRVSVRRDGGLGEITVSDTGPGLSEETQPRIFEPFYRAPDAKGPGTGIGLATVQRIVQAYGGRLTVRSRLGQGATFVVRMPLAERAPVPGPAGEPTPAGQPALH
jgi:two-component system OmpR family sensor kinase